MIFVFNPTHISEKTWNKVLHDALDADISRRPGKSVVVLRADTAEPLFYDLRKKIEKMYGLKVVTLGYVTRTSTAPILETLEIEPVFKNWIISSYFGERSSSSFSATLGDGLALESTMASGDDTLSINVQEIESDYNRYVAECLPIQPGRPPKPLLDASYHTWISEPCVELEKDGDHWVLTMGAPFLTGCFDRNAMHLSLLSESVLRNRGLWVGGASLSDLNLEDIVLTNFDFPLIIRPNSMVLKVTYKSSIGNIILSPVL